MDQRLSPAVGNLGAGLAALLGSFGVVTAETRDEAGEVIGAELAARQHLARVVELRYGRLILEAEPVAARLLGFDRDNLLAALEARLPGVVDEIQVRTARPGC